MPTNPPTNPWAEAFGLRADADGRPLYDDGSGVIGDLRNWHKESRVTREAAMVSCLNALDGRAPLAREIGTNAVVTMGFIAQACPEPALILWAAEQLERRDLASHAVGLRSLASARANKPQPVATLVRHARPRVGSAA